MFCWPIRQGSRYHKTEELRKIAQNRFTLYSLLQARQVERNDCFCRHPIWDNQNTAIILKLSKISKNNIYGDGRKMNKLTELGGRYTIPGIVWANFNNSKWPSCGQGEFSNPRNIWVKKNKKTCLEKPQFANASENKFSDTIAQVCEAQFHH